MQPSEIRVQVAFLLYFHKQAVIVTNLIYQVPTHLQIYNTFI